MKKTNIIYILLLFIAIILLTGCGPTPKDFGGMCKNAYEGTERYRLCNQVDTLFIVFQQERVSMNQAEYREYKALVLNLSDSLYTLIEEAKREEVQETFNQTVKMTRDGLGDPHNL